MKEQAVNQMEWNLVIRKGRMNKVDNFEQRIYLILKREKLGRAKIQALGIFFSTDKTRS